MTETKRITLYLDGRLIGTVYGTHDYAVELGCRYRGTRGNDMHDLDAPANYLSVPVLSIYANGWRVW